jgi:Spy/CpxP family protein refolding chaperone
MKTLTFTLIASAFLAAPLALHAEDGKPNRPEGREGRGGPGGPRFSPEERLKMMTEKLGLNQEQQDKIKAIMEESRGKFEGMKDLTPDERREKMREVMKADREKIGEVLTPEQKEKWKAAMEERRKEGGPRHGKDGNPGKPGEAK